MLVFLYHCGFSGILDGIILIWIFIALVILSVSTQSFYILNYFHNLFWGQTNILLDIWALNILSSKSIAGFLSVIFVKIVSGSSHNVMLEYLMHLRSLKDIQFCWESHLKELFCSIYISEAFKPFLSETLGCSLSLKCSRGNTIYVFWCFSCSRPLFPLTILN